jgi:hypothetical protein
MVVAGCAGYSMDFLANYEPGQDYSKYRTFNFYEKTGTGRYADNPEFDQRLRDAVRAGLTEAGYSMAEKPDFWVTYWIDVTGRERGDPVTSYMSTDPKISGKQEFQRGALVLNFIDGQTNQRYWRGVAMGDLAERVPKDRLEKAVDTILENYPPAD